MSATAYSVDLVVGESALPKRLIGEQWYAEAPNASASFSVEVSNHTSTHVAFTLSVDGVEDKFSFWLVKPNDYNWVEGFDVSDDETRQFRFAQPSAATARDGDARSANGGHIGCVEVTFWPVAPVKPHMMSTRRTAEEYDAYKKLVRPSLSNCASGDIMLKVASELGEGIPRDSTSEMITHEAINENGPLMKVKLCYRTRAQLGVLEDLRLAEAQRQQRERSAAAIKREEGDRPNGASTSSPKRRRGSQETKPVVIDLT